MADDYDDDWERVEDDQADELGPRAKRARHDGAEQLEGDDALLQSIAEITDDAGLDALLAEYSGEQPQEAVEIPSLDCNLRDIIKKSLGEKSRKKAKPSAPEAAPVDVSENVLHITSNTYHRKQNGSGRRSPWTDEEVRRLLLVLQQYGPNFNLLETFFPTRTRQEIKSKYNREDKRNPGFMADILKQHRKIDFGLYEEWKEKSEQVKREAQEQAEIDAVDMTINENDLLAELGGESTHPESNEAAAATTKDDSAGEGPAVATADGEEAAPADEDDDELVDGYVDDFPDYDQPGFPSAYNSMPDDGVEYYD